MRPSTTQLVAGRTAKEGDIVRSSVVGRRGTGRRRWTACPNCGEFRWVSCHYPVRDAELHRLCQRCHGSDETKAIRRGEEPVYPKCTICGGVSERKDNDGKVIHTLTKGKCALCTAKFNALERRKRNKSLYGHTVGADWVKNNEKYRINTMRAHRKLKLQIVEAYGGKCECCGESLPDMLTIDHINGNGAEERRERGTRRKNEGWDFYIYLRRLGFPKDNYRLLCCNCNRGAYMYGGICPHQLVKNLGAEVGDLYAVRNRRT